MESMKTSNQLLFSFALVLCLLGSQCAVHDLTAVDERPSLYRKAREDRYYLNRYGSSSPQGGASPTDRGRRPGIKPDGAHPEAREGDAAGANGVEKRCIRCTTSYLDPYDYRDYYDRYNNYDRYDGRGYEDRYDRYDDRNYGRYDTRNDRSYYDRDRWYDRPYDRSYDRYYYRGNDRNYDRYYDRYDRQGGGGYGGGVGGGGFGGGVGGYDRGYDRGFGYDNRGYDNYRRTAYDSRGMRPYEDTARGATGWDNYGRGGYYGGRPEPSGYWGYDRGYASGYNYGGRGDSWRDPSEASNQLPGRSATGYNRRDPYGYEGYRGTSYLYERNGNGTPNTTERPIAPKDGEPGATDRPDGNPNKAPDNGGSG